LQNNEQVKVTTQAQSEVVGQQNSHLETEQSVKNEPSQVKDINSQLESITDQKVSAENQQPKENGEETLSGENSSGQNFSQVMTSLNEDKSVQQPVNEVDGGRFELENKFDDAVSEKLQATIANSVKEGQNQVTVRLDPPELGKVTIQLRQEDGQITGSLEFSKAETKSQVQQLLPQVINNLQNSGIAVKKLDVIQTSVDNSNTYQQYRDGFADQQAYEQRQFNQNGSYGSFSSGYDWVTGQSSYSSESIYSDSYIEDDAVNILV
jgi:flagellar hook-length control protein FliK